MALHKIGKGHLRFTLTLNLTLTLTLKLILTLKLTLILTLTLKLTLTRTLTVCSKVKHVIWPVKLKKKSLLDPIDTWYSYELRIVLVSLLSPFWSC